MKTQKKREKILHELLEEITHRLIACEQSMRRISAQIEEHLNKGGVK